MPSRQPPNPAATILEIQGIGESLGSHRRPSEVTAELLSMGAKLASLDPASVLDAVRALRRWMWSYTPERWQESRTILGAGMGSQATAWVAECLLSIDSNGHTRQEFVRALGHRLARAGDGALDPAAARVIAGFLTVRLNDWVPQVAAEARSAFLHYLQGATPSELVEQLLFLESLTRLTRMDHSEVQSAWHARLAAQGGEDALADLYDVGDRTQRRLVARTLLQFTEADWRTWVGRFTACHDDVIVLVGLGLARRWLPDDEELAILERAAQEHPVPRIRTQALRSLAEFFAGEPTATATFESALWDRTRRVRRIAQFHLAKRDGRPALAAAYAAALTPGSKTRHIAALGLSETGAASDAPRLLAAFRSEGGSAAAKLLTAYCRLAGEGARSLLLESARADDPWVRTAAIRNLAPDVSPRDEAWITGELSQALAPPRHSAQSLQLLRLTLRLRWDDRMRLILTACPPKTRKERDQIQHHLTRVADDLQRAARRPPAPSASNLEAIRSGLARLQESGSAHADLRISGRAIQAVQWLSTLDAD